MGSMGSTSGREAKIPHALRWIPHALRQKENGNNTVTNSIQALKMAHLKKKILKRGAVSRWDASISMRVGYCLD